MGDRVIRLLKELISAYKVDDGMGYPHCIHCSATVKWLASGEIEHYPHCPIVTAEAIIKELEG